MKKLIFLLLVGGCCLLPISTSANITSVIFDCEENKVNFFKVEGNIPLDTTLRVLIIPGHSAKLINSWPEKDQAPFFEKRGEVVASFLRKKGFSKIEIAPTSLEIGSKVLVLFYESSLSQEEIEAIAAKIFDKRKGELIGPAGATGPVGPAGQPGQSILEKESPIIASTTDAGWDLEIGGNLPNYGYIAKNFPTLNCSKLTLADLEGSGWGIGWTFPPTNGVSLSLLGIMEKFRGEKIIIGDLQANYIFPLHPDWFFSLGLNGGVIFPFEVQVNGEKIEVEGWRAFLPVSLNYTKGNWAFGIAYALERSEVKSSEFKEKGREDEINVKVSFSLWSTPDSCSQTGDNLTFKGVNEKPIEDLSEKISSSPSSPPPPPPPPPTNHAPVITKASVSGKQEVGETVTCELSAYDYDGDSLIFTVIGPGALVQSGNNAIWTWVPTTPGNFSVIFEVNDGKGGKDVITIPLVIAP